jgi:ribosomal protein S18 acetylase RimI-like enzyme
VFDERGTLKHFVPSLKMPLSEIQFLISQTPGEFKIAKDLFEEYGASLSVDLCFQGFDEELQTMHTQYNLPKGCLMLVYENEKAIGCAAIREYEKNSCELKRMYLKQECRGKGIGKKLLQLMSDKAKELGYTKILLDTLPQMKEAQHLYKTFGFKQIDPYRFNPVEGTVYMEKFLA